MHRCNFSPQQGGHFVKSDLTGDIGHFDNPSGGHQALLDIDQAVI